MTLALVILYLKKMYNVYFGIGKKISQEQFYILPRYVLSGKHFLLNQNQLIICFHYSSNIIFNIMFAQLQFNATE